MKAAEIPCIKRRMIYTKVFPLPDNSHPGSDPLRMLPFLQWKNFLSYMAPQCIVGYGISPLVKFCLEWKSENLSPRLFLVILGIYALYLKWVKQFQLLETHVQILEIYFKMINEPYLTVDEMRGFFSDIISGDDKEQVLDKWCKDFEETVPFCTKKYEPRALSHLCRCQLRKSCKEKGHSLSEFFYVMNVPIPNAIKEFTMCKK